MSAPILVERITISVIRVVSPTQGIVKYHVIGSKDEDDFKGQLSNLESEYKTQNDEQLEVQVIGSPEYTPKVLQLHIQSTLSYLQPTIRPMYN